MRFTDLQLIDPLLRAVRDAGYIEPTPIQVQAIPFLLAGRDVLGTAQTGTGKTAAFALPILQRLHEQKSRSHADKRHIKVLVLSPTRELATQIGESFGTYGRYTSMRYVTVYGGVNQKPQVAKLQQGVDVLVATPGRLLDLMNQGFVRLDRLEVLVLDEADRMLDMGFLPDVGRIIGAIPQKRQTLLFSATMPPKIQELASDILIDPARIAVSPESPTVEATEQAVYFVEKDDKRALLEYLLHSDNVTRALVFTRTKSGANRLVKQLNKSSIHAEVIHGNKSQNAREKALANFKRGATRILVATDIAARGIDIDDVSHVINYEIPRDIENYVHRIGRTGRAGAAGKAFSFCSVDEREFLVDIERLIRMNIPVVSDHPYASALGVPVPTDLNQSKRPSKPRSKAQPPNRRYSRGGQAARKRRNERKQQHRKPYPS